METIKNVDKEKGIIEIERAYIQKQKISRIVIEQRIAFLEAELAKYKSFLEALK